MKSGIGNLDFLKWTCEVVVMQPAVRYQYLIMLEIPKNSSDCGAQGLNVSVSDIHVERK